MSKIHKVIINTDPGVDDITAIIYGLNNPRLDIKMFCVTSGNVTIQDATQNLLHCLDIFNKDIPVVCGSDQRLGNNTEHAYHMHGKQGFGNYKRPRTTKHKAIEKDCSDAMYEVIKANPHEITMVLLASHTDFANLLLKHPDAKDLIKDVIMMGGSPDGILTNKSHCSYNIRTDAPAFEITVNSKLPIVMCPSKIGREVTYFSEEQVNQIRNASALGKFLALTYETYWEPDYPEKILSCCDLSALYYLFYPRIFKTKRAFISVDTKELIGKTTATYHKKGNFKIIYDVNRKKFQKHFFKTLDKLSQIEITDKTYWKNVNN